MCFVVKTLHTQVRLSHYFNQIIENLFQSLEKHAKQCSFVDRWNYSILALQCKKVIQIDISNITIKVVENTLQDIVEILKIIDLKQTDPVVSVTELSYAGKVVRKGSATYILQTKNSGELSTINSQIIWLFCLKKKWQMILYICMHSDLWNEIIGFAGWQFLFVASCVQK